MKENANDRNFYIKGCAGVAVAVGMYNSRIEKPKLCGFVWTFF